MTLLLKQKKCRLDLSPPPPTPTHPSSAVPEWLFNKRGVSVYGDLSFILKTLMSDSTVELYHP